LEFLKERERIPDRIDRSVWIGRFSGSSGTQLMTALRTLELVDADGRPGPGLEELVYAEGDRRRSTLKRILARTYEPVFRLDLTRATRSQFREAFRLFGTRENVLVKCEAFFIHAAQDAGLEMSQFITQGRHGSKRAGAGQGQRAKRTEPAPHAVQAHPMAPASPSVNGNEQAPRLAIAEMILKKYPDFDPSWAPEVQAKWLEGMTRLYDRLAAQGDGARADGAEG
jgi:hypothetical protein